jgi:ComF family protein
MPKLLKYALSHARQVRDFILDLIFPIQCLGCGQEGVWLCESCFRKINFKAAQYCLHCKKENKFGEFCSSCRSLYNLNGVWIAGDYENKVLSNLIKSLKYHFAQNINLSLGKFLSLFLQNLINQSQAFGITSLDLQHGQIWRRWQSLPKIPQPLLDLHHALIIPVPLHKRRLRWRGFNQALGLAMAIAKNFNLKISQENLIRVKHKKPQAKLGEIERKENIKNCFAWQGDKLTGQPVILIDDVTTTGSTLNECARVLKQNKAGEIWGLVVAKG